VYTRTASGSTVYAAVILRPLGCKAAATWLQLIRLPGSHGLEPGPMVR
jgi:hypothetical protein